MKKADRYQLASSYAKVKIRSGMEQGEAIELACTTYSLSGNQKRLLRKEMKFWEP
jgi:hypothetical protein